MKTHFFSHERIDLGEGPVMRTLLLMSLPAIGMMILNTLILMVDTVFVSWLGEKQMTAVSLFFPIQIVFFALMEGAGAGATALAGQSLGRGNKRAAQLIAVSSMALTYVICLCALPFFYRPASDVIFNMLGAAGDAAILEHAYKYSFWLPITAPFVAYTYINNCIRRCQGDTVTPLICMSIANLVNGLLDPVLIFVLGLGVEGAAIATLIGRICASAYLYYKWRGSDAIIVPLVPKLRRGIVRYWRQIASIGFPVALSSTSAALGFGYVNRILSGFGGYAVTAMMISLRIEDFASTVVITGVGMALTPFLAYNYGKDDIGRMTKGIGASLIICACFMLVVGGALFAFPHPFIAIFRPTEQAADLAVLSIRAIIIAYPFATVMIMLNSLFVATGRSMYGTVATIVRSICVRVPAAILFAALWGEKGIWWFQPISWLAGCAVAVYFAAKLMKRIKNHIESAVEIEA